jgi:hypothetical protein
VNNGSGFPVPCTDTFPLRPAAPGNEWFLLHRFKGADVYEMEILSVTLGVKLGAGEAAGHLFTTVHEVCIQRPHKPCCTTGIDVSMYFGDIPDMMAELHGEIAKKPGRFQFPDTGGKARAGRADIVDVDF